MTLHIAWHGRRSRTLSNRAKGRKEHGARIGAASIALIVVCGCASQHAFADDCPPSEEDLKLTASDGLEGDLFGRPVSIDGNIAIVGAHFHNDREGAAYVYDVLEGSRLFKLAPPNGGSAQHFGWSVAQYENLAIIGAINVNSAYVFDLTTGEEVATLSADNTSGFGQSVGVHDNCAVVGAVSTAGQTGVAVVFDLTNSSEPKRLEPMDGEEGDRFGWSVAQFGDRAIVGALGEEEFSGAVYVYDLTDGTQLHKLTAPIRNHGDRFGGSVSLEGDLAVIGAWGEDDFAGAVYVFDISTGQQLRRLTASDREPGDRFGNSVSLDGDYVIIGASEDDEVTGSAYIFDITTGAEIRKIIAFDGVLGDRFGESVAMDGEYAIAGARDVNEGTGAAYVFSATPMILTVNPMPLVALESAMFSACTLNPDKRTWLLYSLDGPGTTFIPQLNVFLDIKRPRIAATKRADGDGHALWNAVMPDTAHEFPIWFQVTQNSLVTNSVETTLKP